MEEEEALRAYCRRMISHVLKKQHPDSPEQRGRRKKDKHKEPRGERPTGLRERQRREPGGHVEGVGDGLAADHRERNLPFSDSIKRERYERRRDLTSPSLPSQGPAAQLVPAQLISLLTHKTFKEEMKRAAKVELHDPNVCNACEQKQASLALSTFIRRKKTQLDVQTLEARLNTHLFFCHFEPVGGVWEELFERNMLGRSNLGLPWQRIKNMGLP